MAQGVALWWPVGLRGDCLGPAHVPSPLILLQLQRHLFVHISQQCPSPGAPPLESVDVRQIYDKFPEKKGGLRELYDRGPPHAFFLVKFWVSAPMSWHFQPGLRRVLGLPGPHFKNKNCMGEYVGGMPMPAEACSAVELSFCRFGDMESHL